MFTRASVWPICIGRSRRCRRAGPIPPGQRPPADRRSPFGLSFDCHLFICSSTQMGLEVVTLAYLGSLPPGSSERVRQPLSFHLQARSGVAVLSALAISSCALRSRGPRQIGGSSLDAAVVRTSAEGGHGLIDESNVWCPHYPERPVTSTQLPSWLPWLCSASP